MSPAEHQRKRLESAISLAILVVIVLIAVSVFIRQFNYDMAQYGIGKPDDLIPSPPAGFIVMSEPGVFTADNLFEKIDGKAPFYTESGFERLLTQQFVSRQDETEGFELYLFDMGNARGAFSVYSRQKRQNALPLPDVRFGYKTANALYLAQGRYYLELIGWSDSPQLSAAMTEVVEQFVGKFATERVSEITELSLFGVENLVDGSFKLYLSGAFGFKGLGDTFTAQYTTDGQMVTAFLSERQSNKQARKISEDYFEFLLDNGGTTKPTADEALRSAQGKVVELFGDIEIVFSTGKYLGGVHAAQDQEHAEKIAVKLIRKLSSASN